MSATERDVVVIGGGHNGLACAAYLGRAGVDVLELKRFGYEVSIITPDYFVPFPDGTSLTLWGDATRDAANIARFSKRDADAYVEFDRYFDRVARLLKDLLFVVPPDATLRDAPAWLAMAARMRGRSE